MLKQLLVVLTAVFFLQLFHIHRVLGDAKNIENVHSAKRKHRAKDNKVLYFASLPVYYFFVEIPIHEGAHALAVGLNPNWKLTKFQPYPHYAKDRDSYIFGSITKLCANKNRCPDKIGSGVISLAPYIMASTIFTISDALLYTESVDAKSTAGRALYFAGMVIPWWDLSYNAVWAVKGSDASRMAINFQIPLWSVMAAGIGISTVGAWRLLSGYKRAFSTCGKRCEFKKTDIVVAPMANSDTFGALVLGRF